MLIFSPLLGLIIADREFPNPFDNNHCFMFAVFYINFRGKADFLENFWAIFKSRCLLQRVLAAMNSFTVTAK